MNGKYTKRHMREGAHLPYLVVGEADGQRQVVDAVELGYERLLLHAANDLSGNFAERASLLTRKGAAAVSTSIACQKKLLSLLIYRQLQT